MADEGRELLRRTAELPDSEQGLLDVLTEYRHAVYAFVAITSGVTAWLDQLQRAERPLMASSVRVRQPDRRSTRTPTTTSGSDGDSRSAIRRSRRVAESAYLSMPGHVRRL
jgi:hypothetical protein